MAPDDPSGIRELRFTYGKHHVIVTAAPDGSGDVKVVGDFYHLPVDDMIKKEAIQASLRLISIARRWMFEEFRKLGGTVEELREDTGPVEKL